MQTALAPLGLAPFGSALGATKTLVEIAEGARKAKCGQAGDMWIFGRCVPKLYVYGGAGAAALLALLAVRRFSKAA